MAISCKKGVAANQRRSGSEGHRFKTYWQQELFTADSPLKIYHCFCDLYSQNQFMWQMHWLNVYIRFTRERCNRSSVNKRSTWIVATFKKAAALGTKVGFCTRWLKFCSTKAIIFLSLPSNDPDELKNPIYFHLRSSRASILMKFCKSAKIVELQKTFSRFSRSLSKTELHRKWLFGSSSLSQEKNQGQEKFWFSFGAH